MKENVFEEKFGNSFGINSFVTWGENYPLQKAMVDHNHQQIKTMRQWEIVDEINGQLLEWAGAG